MTTEGNTNHELVGIPTPDGVKNIHPEVLKQHLKEAFEHLDKVTEGNSGFKSLMADIEESSGIPKAIFGKWAKARYKDKTKETGELADAFAALDEAAPEQKAGV